MCEGVIPSVKYSDLQKSPSYPRTSAGVVKGRRESTGPC